MAICAPVSVVWMEGCVCVFWKEHISETRERGCLALPWPGRSWARTAKDGELARAREERGDGEVRQAHARQRLDAACHHVV